MTPQQISDNYSLEEIQAAIDALESRKEMMENGEARLRTISE